MAGNSFSHGSGIDSYREQALIRLVMIVGSKRSPFILWALVLLCFATQYLAASSSGHVSGLIQDQSGRPLSNILIVLLRTPSAQALPILGRSDGGGEIRFNDIAPGNYEVLVKSAKYLNLRKNVIEVAPGKTTVASLVLQQLFGLGFPQEENLSVKTLLRNAGDERLVFRNLPQAASEASLKRTSGSFPGEAVLKVYGNAGLRRNSPASPGDAAGGTTSNFAVTQSMGGDRKYVLAGQLNSGEDALWRMKNAVEYSLSDSHNLGVFFGYGRVSLEQPSLALLDQPEKLGEDLDYSRTLETIKILSLGVQEEWNLGETLSLIWGLELNRVDSNHRQTFLSPNVEVSYSPTEKSKVRVQMASKRPTYTGSLVLPNGDVMNLREAVSFSRMGDRFSFGVPRHYRGSITQQLMENTEIEFAAYENQLIGGTTAFLAVFESHPDRPDRQIFHLDDEEATNRGYRVVVRRRLGNSVKTSVSYIRGRAAGLSRDGVTLVLADTTLQPLIERQGYYTVATEVEAYIPSSRTHLSALVKFLSNGNPLTTLDAFADTYETGNEGINLFVRQVVPVPTDWLTFLGLDFMSAYEIEALVDIRNLTNEDLGTVRVDMEDLSLVRNPRTVRGGISVRF